MHFAAVKRCLCGGGPEKAERNTLVLTEQTALREGRNYLSSEGDILLSFGSGPFYLAPMTLGCSLTVEDGSINEINSPAFDFDGSGQVTARRLLFSDDFSDGGATMTVDFDVTYKIYCWGIEVYEYAETATATLLINDP